MIYFDTIPSPIGHLLVTSDGVNLTGLYLENHKGGPSIDRNWSQDSSKFGGVKSQLASYFAGNLKKFDVAIRTGGTEFQRAVWKQLDGIPFGETLTYGEIAKRLGDPHASRAVGTAVGRNPVSIIVPCHRVVGSHGAITGYAGGLERKRFLLDHERVRLF